MRIGELLLISICVILQTKRIRQRDFVSSLDKTLLGYWFVHMLHCEMLQHSFLMIHSMIACWL